MTKYDDKYDNYGFLTWRNSDLHLSDVKNKKTTLSHSQLGHHQRDQDSLLCEPSICNDTKHTDDASVATKSKPSMSWWKYVFNKRPSKNENCECTNCEPSRSDLPTTTKSFKTQRQEKIARRCQSMVFPSTPGNEKLGLQNKRQLEETSKSSDNLSNLHAVVKYPILHRSTSQQKLTNAIRTITPTEICSKEIDEKKCNKEAAKKSQSKLRRMFSYRSNRHNNKNDSVKSNDTESRDSGCASPHLDNEFVDNRSIVSSSSDEKESLQTPAHAFLYRIYPHHAEKPVQQRVLIHIDTR